MHLSLCLHCCYFTWDCCWKIAYEVKWRYMKALLSQDEEWYDQINCNELPSEINSNVAEIRGAIGKIIVWWLYSVGHAVGSIIVSFYWGVVLSVPMMIIWIYIIIVGGFQGYTLTQGEVKDEQTFQQSGSEAEQALNSIKVVKAFGQENYEVQRFEKHLLKTDYLMTKYSWYFGISRGLFESSLYFIPAYSLLLGGLFIVSSVSQ